MNREEAIEYANKLNELEKQKFELMRDHIINNYDLLDADGYPTLNALMLIETWHWSDPKGWFEFIKSIWWMPDVVFFIEEYDDIRDSKVYRYNISTGGWSGNESIITAMEQTDMLWGLNWVQSRRGGHYIFELKEVKE